MSSLRTGYFSSALLFRYALQQHPHAVVANPCSVSYETPSTLQASDRIVSVSLNCTEICSPEPYPLNFPCWYKMSEDPNFEESDPGRVKIDILDVATDETWADVSITYPGGTSSGPDTGSAFHVQPQTKTVNILCVMYAFEDSTTGEISGWPSYATHTWLDNTCFGMTEGFDGQPTANSIKAHITQNSYGRVVIEGKAFDGVARLPIEEFFDPLDTYPIKRPTVEAILDYILENDPMFFDGWEFDFLIGFSTDRYNVEGSLEGFTSGNTLPGYPAHPSIRGYINSQMPVTETSLLYNEIVDEPRVSFNESIVSTRYDPSSTGIEVRLASDTDHTGINYFTGGLVLPASNSRGRRYFKLGTTLPANQTDIVVTYTPSISTKLKYSVEQCFPPDTLIYDDRWYSRYIHELYHAIGMWISFNGMRFGDMYRRPGKLERYDIMDNGFITTRDNFLDTSKFGTCSTTFERTYYEASHLSGYNKAHAQFLFPREVLYGTNIDCIRIYKMEENDFTNTNQRTKLVRVELRPKGDPGIHRMKDYSKSQSWYGAEYLLLEWRYGGPLESGIDGFNGRNTDKYLPSKGLMITHVVHDPSYRGTGSTHGYNIVQILDATPPDTWDMNGPFSDTSQYPTTQAWVTSPALFGPESGVFSIAVPALWQQMDDSGFTEKAVFLLSEGSGSKTIYMKFLNRTGVEDLGTASINFDLIDDSTASDRLPSMSIKYLADNHVVGVTTNTTRLDIDVTAPNGVVRSFWEYDGVPKGDSSGDNTVDFLRTGEPDQDHWPGDGFHFARYYAFDRAGIRFGTTYPFYKYTIIPSSNMLPIANAGSDMTVTIVGGHSYANVCLYAGASVDPDGIIMAHEWLENGQVVSTSEIFASRRQAGIYEMTLRVIDNWAAQDSTDVTVTVLNPALNPTSSPTKKPSESPTKGPTSNPSLSPTPLKEGFCSDNSGRCSMEDISECSCNARRNLIKGREESELTMATGYLRRNLAKKTSFPTPSLTNSPTKSPLTVSPTNPPTNEPTSSPSKTPTLAPTQGPTGPTPCTCLMNSYPPSHSPTSQPTDGPTTKPSSLPTTAPSTQPTNAPMEPLAQCVCQNFTAKDECNSCGGGGVCKWHNGNDVCNPR